jgi:phospholipid N-methyltransferase
MIIKNEIMVILRNAKFEEPSTVILQGQLDRKTYTETNKVLEGLGFSWNKKAKAHVAIDDISDKWYNMIDTSEWLDVKRELQFFPTPKAIVDRMIDMIDWKEGMKVLEPSLGTGNIAFNLPNMKFEIDCVEINKEMADKCNMTYPQNSNFYNIINVDFMEFSNDEKYDVIIANPPFTKLQSIKHFNRMKSLLSDNGQLVCIVPAGDIDKNSSLTLRKEFSKFVEEECEVIELDNGDFKESGTMVKTVIVKHQK